MFLLNLVLNIENYSEKKKKDAGGGRGKEKDWFFFFATATPQIKRTSLETQVEKRITIDCLHYFHSGEKYINTIKSDMIYTDGGAQNKSPLASSQTRTGLKKMKTVRPFVARCLVSDS